MRGLYQRGVGFADWTEARVARQGWRDCDFAPLARRQTRKPVWADCHAYQTQGRVTHGCGHAPHLTVTTLGDSEFDPGGRDVAANADGWIARPQFRLRNESDFRRACAAVVEHDAIAQLFERFRGWRAFDLCPIGLGQFVFRVRDPCLQRAIVGEQ